MTALRIGIVGSRFAAHLHLLAYRRVYGVDVRLAGVTSPTAARRKAFADESGATPYPDLAAMLPTSTSSTSARPRPPTSRPLSKRSTRASMS